MTTTEDLRAAAPVLTEEFVLRIEVAPPIDLGTGMAGHRLIAELIRGRASGPRFNAVLLTGGADWILLGPDGIGRIDVRSQLQTDDGAFVYMQYRGLIEMNAAVHAAITSGRECEFTDQYCRVVVKFETGDDRYRWLQERIFLAQGRPLPGGIEYRVFRVD
jgi:hypothetical protein